MFRSARDRSRALSAYFLLDLFGCGARVYGLGLGGHGDVAVEVGVRADQLGFALVPDIEDGGRGCAA